MKFGKYLAKRHLDLPEYADHFIDYKGLKKLIKRLGSEQGVSGGLSPQRLQENKATFFFQLERELERVQQFYDFKEQDIEARLRELEQKKELADRSGTALTRNSVVYISLYEGLQRFRRDLGRLEQFVELNGIGFSKVLKKWDKRSRSHTKELYLSRAVEVQPMFHRDILVQLSDRSNTLLLELEAAADGDSVVYSTPSKNVPELSDDLYFEFVNFATMYDPDNADAREAMAGWITELQVGENPQEMCNRVFLRAIGSDATDSALMALLDSGNVDVTAVDEVAGKNVLHMCASCDLGREPLFEASLATKLIDVNQLDSYGRTPLHHAAMHHRRTFIAQLLQAGTSPDIRDHDNHAALHLAIWRQFDDVVSQLLDNGAQTQGFDAERYYVPLNFACQRGAIGSVRLLLQKRPNDAQVADAEGLFPLHIAARAGFAELVPLLTKASSKETINQLDKLNDWTPLMYAAAEGHADVLRALLDANSDPSVLDVQQRTAMFYAAIRGHPQCLNLLDAATNNDIDISRVGAPITKEPAAHDHVEDEMDNDADALSSEGSLDNLEDGIPDLALPPPILPLQRYGHSFLDSKKVILQISGISLHFSEDRKGLSAGRLILTTSGTRDSIPRNLPLPINESDAVQTFQVDWLDQFAMSVEILPTFGSRFIAKTTALPYVFTGEGPQEAEIPIVDALLRTVGSLRFSFLVVKPYPGKPLEISKYDTYWKSTTSATMLSFITASSLHGEYQVLPIVLTRDLVPVVMDSHYVLAGNIRICVPGFTLAELRNFAGSIRTLEEVLQDPATPPKLNLFIPFPTKAEFNIDGYVPVRWPHMNTYVDEILHAVFNHARLVRHEAPDKAHSLVFTSTNPEICAFLNWKQPNFPVLFVLNAMRTDGLHTTANRWATSEHSFNEMAVCVSLEEAAHYASTNNLMGLIAPGDLMRLVPSVVPATRVLGLVLVSNGDGAVDGVDGNLNGNTLTFPENIDI